MFTKSFKFLRFLGVAAVAVFALSSCSDDDEPASESYPSYRDGYYKASQVEVTIDGAPVPTVTGVNVDSELIDPGVFEDGSGSNPQYVSVISVYGFPDYGSKPLNFTAFTDVQGFETSVRANNGNFYKVKGTFTATPFDHHDSQGIILEFTTI